MSKGIRVYLSRDTAEGDWYSMFSKKPQLMQGWWKPSGDSFRRIDHFCPEDFERITRYKLKPGECKRVRINIEEV